MYSVKSRSGRRGTVLTNYAHDMTRLMLRAPISWFSSGSVSNVKMGRNVRQSSRGSSNTILISIKDFTKRTLQKESGPGISTHQRTNAARAPGSVKNKSIDMIST